MNPMTNMKNVLKLSEQELHRNSKSSWHDQYRDSAWVFVGGLPYDLSEGDLICIFSQYGEVVNINLIRDKDSGKSKGFCFLCYEDQRSTVLAVDNFNGIKILNRTIRVDHVSNYKVPKDGKKTDTETKKLHDEGCAPKPQSASQTIIKPIEPPPQDLRETLADQITPGIKLPPRLPIYTIKEEPVSEIGDDEKIVKVKKEKKDKKKKSKKHKKKKGKKKRKKDSSSDSASESSAESDNENESNSDKESKTKRKRKE